MRVRINFTVDFDLDQYREATGQPDLTTGQAREQVQAKCLGMLLQDFNDNQVKYQYLGQNNRYDPETRQTIHEEYVNAT